MEFSPIAPRPAPTPLSGPAAAIPDPTALSAPAETNRPVWASASVDAAKEQKGFEPLDTFAVGDNDHIPVPPEPPRKETVLAIMADATHNGEQDETAAPQASPPAATDAMAAARQEIEAGPYNPTVDIRR